MTASTKIRFITYSLEETRHLGQQLGEYLQPGTILAFTGDLGSGKTTFVQGIASGLDILSNDYITSPTYTLINEYKGRCRLFHIDLYRINNLKEIEDIGINDILCGESVVAIEWAEKLPDTFLSDHVSIAMEIIDDQSRQIHVIAYGHEAENLIGKIQK